MALPHELLTPLNGILGFTSIMTDEGLTFTPDEIRDFARNIEVSALRLHRIIENFIIYSETELIRGTAEKLAELRAAEPIQVREALERLAHEKAAAFSRENDLALEVEEGFVPMGSSYFLKMAGEVIDNAFKFSQLGSPVRVTGRVQNGRYRIEVSDRGRGMTPQQIADIGAHMQFERRFYEQQGVGLGLVVARRLADLQGGGLLIDSKPGEYTTVILDLPLQAEPAPEAPAVSG
jgi:signal transduction histidine kinase